MNSTELATSSEWTAVEHLWEEVAEAWFKPEGDGSTFMFRVPLSRFQASDTNPQLTIEDLLKAAAISNEDVESWRVEGNDETDPELRKPLSPPSPDATHLTVYVRVKPPAQTALGNESEGQEISPEQWQALEARWRTILGLEVSIDNLRQTMEGLRIEMEAAFKKPLVVEEKIHALQADVLQWTKAKSRVHYALPKVREFIHRATWASGAHERKELEELVTKYIEPRIPYADMDHLRDRLDHLQKDRQVLFAQGNSVNQVSREILGEIHRALTTLQRNAANIARNRRSAGREKGKYF